MTMTFNTPAVKFLENREKHHFIDGQWRAGSGGRRRPFAVALCPATLLMMTADSDSDSREQQLSGSTAPPAADRDSAMTA